MKEKMKLSILDKIKKNKTITAACMSHTGCIRQNNEDNFYFGGKIMPEIHLSMEKPEVLDFLTRDKEVVALFDGMGGEAAGELASFTAAEGVSRYLELIKKANRKELTEIIRKINFEVCAAAEREKYSQIGTTVSMVIFRDNSVVICNLGDSPIYIYRNGSLKLLSVIHNNSESLKKMGINNIKPSLTQFLGVKEEEFFVEPFVDEIFLEKEDLILMCSDGLTDMISEDEIKDILEDKISCDKKVEKLVEKAVVEGGKDNITVIVNEVV